MSAGLRTMIASLGPFAVAGPAKAGEWKQEIAPYFWGSGMSGTTGIGNVTAVADVSFSDILHNLKLVFMGTCGWPASAADCGRTTIPRRAASASAPPRTLVT